MITAEVMSPTKETEVTEKAKRRTFTVEYKRRIVRDGDACRGSGEIAALLRREGLYSSHLTNWRAARDLGELAPGASKKKRGPQGCAPDPRDKKIAELERENARLAEGGVPSALKVSWRCRKKSRLSWDDRSRARTRDGNGRAARITAWHRAHVRGDGAILCHLLSAFGATTTVAVAPGHPRVLPGRAGPGRAIRGYFFHSPRPHLSEPARAHRVLPREPIPGYFGEGRAIRGYFFHSPRPHLSGYFLEGTFSRNFSLPLPKTHA
jgi:transposase-like protein